MQVTTAEKRGERRRRTEPGGRGRENVGYYRWKEGERRRRTEPGGRGKKNEVYYRRKEA